METAFDKLATVAVGPARQSLQVLIIHVRPLNLDFEVDLEADMSILSTGNRGRGGPYRGGGQNQV